MLNLQRVLEKAVLYVLQASLVPNKKQFIDALSHNDCKGKNRACFAFLGTRPV